MELLFSRVDPQSASQSASYSCCVVAPQPVLDLLFSSEERPKAFHLVMIVGQMFSIPVWNLIRDIIGALQWSKNPTHKLVAHY